MEECGDGRGVVGGLGGGVGVFQCPHSRCLYSTGVREDMQNHLIACRPVPAQMTMLLHSPVAALPKLVDDVTPGQFSEWVKWWLVFVAATNLSVGQKANFLAVGNGTASQVLAEFPDGVHGITFDSLLVAVKRHAVIPEAAAIWHRAAYALQKQSAQQFVG